MHGNGAENRRGARRPPRRGGALSRGPAPAAARGGGVGGVAVCSGVGLRALRRVQGRADELAVPLAWVVGTPAMWRLLRGTGVAGFSCYPDRAGALGAGGGTRAPPPGG